MPPRAPQFGDKARFGVPVGPNRYWTARAGRAGAGIHPAMTKPSSEEEFWPEGAQLAPRTRWACGCSTEGGLWRAAAPHLCPRAAQKLSSLVAAGPGLRPRGSAISTPYPKHTPMALAAPLGTLLWPTQAPPRWHPHPIARDGSPEAGQASGRPRSAGRDRPSNAKPAL